MRGCLQSFCFLTVGSLTGWTMAMILGGLLTQGPAGAPAGVIIEKTGLLRVSNGPSRRGMFGWNVFTLYYPTHCEKSNRAQLLKTLRATCKGGWRILVLEYPCSAGRQTCFCRHFSEVNSSPSLTLEGNRAALLHCSLYKVQALWYWKQGRKNLHQR